MSLKYEPASEQVDPPKREGVDYSQEGEYALFLPFGVPLHPAHCTLHTTHYTLHTTPCTQHSKHHTLHSTPYTLRPTPYTTLSDVP